MTPATIRAPVGVALAIVVGVTRRAILAGVLAAIAPASPAVAGNLDRGGTTPVARSGSELAARGSLSESQLRRKLEREMDRVGGGSGAWVFALRDSERVYSHSGGRRRLLASNSKLFATAAFLDRFGSEGRLETGLWTRGGRTGAGDRVLRGDLVLVGDGDPALASRRFARGHGTPQTSLRPLADAVHSAGIRRVRGGILADPTIFDSRRSVPQPGISGGPFLSTLSGLSFNSGFDGGRYARNPALKAGKALMRAIEAKGVKIRGGVRVGAAPNRVTAREALATSASPTAASLIARTNTPSDNFFAEMLLKRLAARASRQGTTARGARKAERFARSVGSGASLVNGSGLSRTNAASPREVGRLLVHMGRDPDLDRAWRDSLAVAGRTGTLANRMRGTAAQGRCQAKTGTIDGVSALSGYCRTGNGRVAFSILMNGVNVDVARRAQDAMAATIARFG